MTTAGVTSCSGEVLPAVSTILPVVSSTALNDVLTSTLGQPNTETPPSLDALRSVGKTKSSKEGAEESTEDSDADVGDNSDSSESHGGGTITSTEKKGSHGAEHLFGDLFLHLSGKSWLAYGHVLF